MLYHDILAGVPVAGHSDETAITAGERQYAARTTTTHHDLVRASGDRALQPGDRQRTVDLLLRTGRARSADGAAHRGRRGGADTPGARKPQRGAPRRGQLAGAGGEDDRVPD